MAEVFAARIRGEAGFEKLVAVKRMLPHLVEDEHFVDMFLDEARVAVHVASPHVVQTLDLGRGEDGSLYIAMELVVGCSLAVLVREARKANQRVPICIALEILAQAAQGLDDAHEAVTPTGVQLGIVHRDVSPHNLLVGADGRTRVTDFGIARALMRRTSTAAGELKGKFAYFSPEQADGLPVDRRSDVFALGIVAWETFLGRRLFTGEDMMQTLMRVRTQEIQLLHEIDDAIPPAVSLVVAKALERKVENRYATAHDFAVALREVARTVGPTPRAREIGAWVTETAGETLQKIRTAIDTALAGDDVETIARVSSPNPSSKSQPKFVTSAPTPSPVIVPAADPEPSTPISTTLPSAGRPKSRAPLVIAGLLIAGVA
ncbi:MAG: serine/threonine-protein kinase, partial [Polyangiales bacterium]